MCAWPHASTLPCNMHARTKRAERVCTVRALGAVWVWPSEAHSKEWAPSGYKFLILPHHLRSTTGVSMSFSPSKREPLKEWCWYQAKHTQRNGCPALTRRLCPALNQRLCPEPGFCVHGVLCPWGFGHLVFVNLVFVSLGLWVYLTLGLWVFVYVGLWVSVWATFSPSDQVSHLLLVQHAR